MAEGSLKTEITNLQTALTGITGLLGTPGEGGSGLAGGASLTASASIGKDGVKLDVDAQFSAVFSFDPAAVITRLQAAFDQIKGQLDLAPIEGIAQFTGRLDQVKGVFAGDLFAKIQQIVASIGAIANSIPANRMGVLAPLVEQLLAVMNSLRGPEAEQIQGWIESLEMQISRFQPLIEAAANHPNPVELLLEAVGGALAGVLDVFEFPRVNAALGFLDGAPGNLMPQALVADLDVALHGCLDTFQPMISLAADPVALNAAIAVHLDAQQALRVKLRPVIAALQAIGRIDLLKPGTLEARLRRLLDQALAIDIQDNQKIDDPFKSLLDRIDAEIGKIDLSFVRDEVLGFFLKLRQALEGVNIGNVGNQLQGQLDAVDKAVTGLQQGVTDLIQKVADHFAGLVDKLKQVFGSFGTFEADNSFSFHLEQDLRQVLGQARLAVAGDPNNPAAPSIAGTLHDFQTTIDQFLGKLTTLLQPLENASLGVVDDAVNGINSFATFLTELNIPGLMEGLAAKVDEILDQLGPIDFGVVIDPVVAELDANAEKIRQIDTDSLNDLLKMALNEALGVIMDIDFTVTISAPLLERFAAVKAVPAQAVQVLQDQYDKAVALLDQLSPKQLLSALLAAFDVIKNAVGTLNITALLAPLDQTHHKYLVAPLAELQPSKLLAPVAAGYQSISGGLNNVSGAALIAPLTGKLAEVKAGITGLDLTAPLDDLLAFVAAIKQALAEVRPSELLVGFSEAFAQLEAELDKFKPSVVFAPVAQLADPLLAFLENIQQEAITALFDLFQAPLKALERLNPEALVAEIRGKLDAVLALLKAIDPSVKFNALKANYFDLKGAVSAGGVQASIDLSVLVDPQRQFGEIMADYQLAIQALENAKQNLALPDLGALYEEVKQRLMDLLPPYARVLLDPETFKRLMRQASPLRFLEELDTRFEAIKNKLIPIRPQDLGAELDATYETVLALVAQLDISEPIGRIVAAVANVKGIVDGIRVDFVAEDIDKALATFKAVLAGLDPARFFADLDAIHAELTAVVEQTKPSAILAGLQLPLDQIKAILTNFDPRNKLEKPLLEAWDAVKDSLAQIDFTLLLKPFIAKLDELEVAFVAGLRQVEEAFDAMLAAGKTTLDGGALSVSIDISAGVSF